MLPWRFLLLCLCFLLPPLQAADTFCYDTPNDTGKSLAVQVQGQRIYGEHTARIAGWLLQRVPTATFVDLPWQRCLNEVRLGRIDGLLSIGWTPERASWFEFPMRDAKPDVALALYDVPYNIYVRRDSPLQWDGQRFLGLQYGLLTYKGYLAEQRLRELNALSPLDLDISQAVDLLLKQRIDGYVLSPGTTEQQFAAHPKFAQIRRLDQPLLQLPLYFVFSHQYCQQDANRCQQLWQHLAMRRHEFDASAQRSAH